MIPLTKSTPETVNLPGHVTNGTEEYLTRVKYNASTNSSELVDSGVQMDLQQPEPNSSKLGKGQGNADAILRLTGPAVLLNIRHKSKAPTETGWQRLTLEDMNPGYLQKLHNNIGVSLGTASGGLYSIDCDEDAFSDEMLALNPQLRDTLQSRARRGRNFWIRVSGNAPKSGTIRNGEGKTVGEWRGDGNQTVIHGTHPMGMDYSHNGISVLTVDFDSIKWPEMWVLPWQKSEIPKAHAPITDDPKTLSPSMVQELLSHIEPRPDYDTWLRISASVRNALGDNGIAIELLNQWSPEEIDGEYGELLRADFSKISGGTLIHHARKGEYTGSVYPNAVSAVNSSIPLIQLPGNGRVVSEFAEELGKLLNSKGLFSRRGSVFSIQREEQKLAIMLSPTLRTWLEQFALPFKIRISQGGSFNVKETITKDLADTVLSSPQFIDQLPAVERFHPCPMPWMREDGTIELLPLGLDVESQTYTVDPGFQIQRLALKEANDILDTLLEEFAWNKADNGRSKAVHISAMLTVFAGGILPPGSIKPVFLYLANAEGSGKTTLAQLAGLPYLATPVETAPTTEEEWQKKFMSVVISGRRLLLIDNVKGHLDSPSLEAYTTASNFSGRILGANKEFTGEAGASVLITGNSLTTSGDLRRRSLLVELCLTQLKAEDRKFKRALDSVAMKEVRRDVLCALWTLVCEWNDCGRPKGTIHNSSFPRWCDTIAGIVEFAGYSCPAEEAAVEGAGDVDLADFTKLLLAMGSGRKNFAEVAKIAVEQGLFDRVTAKIDFNGELLAGAKRQLSALLRRYSNRQLTDGRKFLVEGSGHSRFYSVVGGGTPLG